MDSAVHCHKLHRQIALFCLCKGIERYCHTCGRGGAGCRCSGRSNEQLASRHCEGPSGPPPLALPSDSVSLQPDHAQSIAGSATLGQKQKI